MTEKEIHYDLSGLIFQSGVQSPPPSGGSVIMERGTHEHLYQVVATDKMLVRWCQPCGKTWIAYIMGISSFCQWEEVKEPGQ